MKAISTIFLVFIVFCAVPLFAGPDPEILSVEVLNWDGTPSPGGLQFTGVDDATAEAPWVHSPQYIRLIYDSDEALWGIRIVTDNDTDIGEVYPDPQNQGTDGEWEWTLHPDWGGRYRYEAGEWQTGDDSVSIGGLIDPSTKENPNYRADLAWQVYNDPVAEPDPIYQNWAGVWNVGGNWNDDWAYVVDKSNMWYGTPSVGGIFYPGTWNAKYEMVATGNPLIGYLAQHPVVSGSRSSPDPKIGDGDIAIYIAANFGGLPAGNYRTRLYLELVHE